MEQAKLKIFETLSGIYPENELISISRLLLSKVSGFNFTGLITNKNTIFSDTQRFELENYLQRLAKLEPIQYVLGKTEFYGLNFYVNSSVLIPRPETEELVDLILKENKRTGLKIIDIGTGSGCIPVALKINLPDAFVAAVDISDEALETASKNAEIHQVKIDFYKENALDLSPVFLKHFEFSLDVVVSNPPYIPHSEINTMNPNVTEFEPHLALFVPDNDPLLFYRSIAIASLKLLKPGGGIYFEIHRDFGLECVNLLETLGYTKVLLRKDIFGNQRIVSAIKPLE